MNKMAQLATLPLAPPNTLPLPQPLLCRSRPCPGASILPSISPDGSHYAILADPRLPDPLAEVHTVIEDPPTSLYVVGADGSGGAWWCPALRDVAEVAWSRDGTSIAV